MKIGSTAPANAPHVIFVGSPETNANMKPFAGTWPSGEKKLTDQGHLLRSVTHNNRPALLIGGGSPVATYWAVAEFGHRLGIRSMLLEDLSPINPPDLKLDGVDVVLEPAPRLRGWYLSNRWMMDTAAWTLDEYRVLLTQLAKLRFNHVTIHLPTDQPFLHLEYDGVVRKTATGLFGINVTGDTLGRKVFGGAKRFEQPFVAGLKTYNEQRAAGEKHVRGIVDAAHELGMTVCLDFPLGELTAEFDPRIDPAAKPAGLGSHFSPDFKKLPSDKKLAGLLTAQLRAVITTYPSIDELQIEFSGIPELTALLSQPNVLRRADGRELAVMGHVGYGEPHATVEPCVSPKGALTPKSREMIAFGNRGVLPQFDSQVWQERWNAAAKPNRDGFVIGQWGGIGLEDLPVYWLSRVSCGERLTPKAACEQLLSAVCGPDVVGRVWRAFELIESATQTSARNSDGWFGMAGLSLSEPKDSKSKPVPAWWLEVQDHFLNAMNEMYRANTRAREGGRSFTLYHARQFEFAYEAMNVLQAQRNAAIAHQEKDTPREIAELEKAIESLNNGLNAMAAVARNNSDRGLIAVLNEYCYRPLKKKLAEAEAEAK